VFFLCLNRTIFFLFFFLADIAVDVLKRDRDQQGIGILSVYERFSKVKQTTKQTNKQTKQTKENKTTQTNEHILGTKTKI
jgi:hypothetical protein